MEKVLLSTPQATHTMVSGRTTRRTSLVCTRQLQVPDMKDSGEMTSSTEMVSRTLLVERDTKESIRMALKTVKENIRLQMALFTRVNGLKIRFMAMASKIGWMGKYTMGSGLRTTWKDLGCTFMQTKLLMRGSSRTTKRQGTVFMYGPMVGSFRVGGTMGNSTAMVFILATKRKRNTVYGNMEND